MFYKNHFCSSIGGKKAYHYDKEDINIYIYFFFKYIKIIFNKISH